MFSIRQEPSAIRQPDTSSDASLTLRFRSKKLKKCLRRSGPDTLTLWSRGV
jgi:hypothetical protein